MKTKYNALSFHLMICKPHALTLFEPEASLFADAAIGAVIAAVPVIARRCFLKLLEDRDGIATLLAEDGE